MTSIFQTPQKELEEVAWQLMLRQPAEKEIYMQNQKQILKEIFDYD